MTHVVQVPKPGAGRVSTYRFRARFPEEYIILVGGPCNTFNGYCSIDPSINNFVAHPAPRTVADVLRYLRGDPKNEKPGTHDLYWANFLFAAVRLVEIREVAPRPGDIVTFIVYLPPYEFRQQIDWEASPYNPRHEPIIPSGRGAVHPDVRDRLYRRASPSHDETVINHDILMRTTGGDDGFGFPKLARSPTSYLETLHDLPRRVVMGHRWDAKSAAPTLDSVLVKLLLLRDKADLWEYLKHGRWNGTQWRHGFDMHSDHDSRLPLELCSYDYYAETTRHPRYRAWEDVPEVDRARVRIRRFDYLGHSAEDVFILQYGWTNPKGELPDFDVTIYDRELEPRLSPELFVNDAIAKLWGCSLGVRMAPKLTKYFKTVVATEGRSEFEHVIKQRTNLPTTEGPKYPWRTYSP
jgi:hypothetical protein